MLGSDWIELGAVVKLLLQSQPAAAAVEGVSAEPPGLQLTQQAIPEPAAGLLLSLESMSQIEAGPVVDSM